MILSVSLSPSIDVNIEVDSLSVGMSHRIISKRTFLTGKALNSAIGLARLGAQSFATGFMYEDNGKLFEQELHKEGVLYKFVWCEGRVTENYKFIDRRSMLTEVNDIPSEVPEEKQRELVETVDCFAKSAEAVIISGNLAKGMSAEYYGELLNRIPRGVKKVVDAEGDCLTQSLKYGVDLVKPNLDELQRTLKVTVKSKESALSACRKLVDAGAERVLLSLGKNGAIITDGDKAYYCKSINVAMNSTAGAGDAMVAAATKSLACGGDLTDILRCGVAAGTAAVTLSDSISFKKEKYEEIFSSLTVQEI